MSRKIPVTVLSGFLGAGKTTLLNHLLTSAQDRRIGVLVNDLSEVNVDAALVVRASSEVVELSNGCICCTLRDELAAQIVRLARQGDLDYLVVESTGVSEPLPVAQGFLLEAEGVPVAQVARLDTLVTVVDASTFLGDFASLERVEDRDPLAPAEDRRNLVDLLVDQVEFADVLVLNKGDQVSARDADRIRIRLRALNPTARILTTQHGRVEPSLVLGTGLFDLERSQSLPAWERELATVHVPETEAYGISHFVVRSDLPFHPERLYQYFEKKRPELLRAKGWFTLATQPGVKWVFHVAGNKKRIEFGGKMNRYTKTGLVELVCIGLFGTKHDRWQADLEACLLQPGESVQGLRDPFAPYLAQVKG